MFIRILSILLINFLFVACVGKKTKNQESVFFTMKTDKVKFSDMGFLYLGELSLKIEIYATGQPLLDLEINSENICLSFLECMGKKDFHEEVLSVYYPETLLEDVLRASPIFNGLNLENKEEGFTQKIYEQGQYDISYSVVRGNRVFRDKINKILIKVREVQ
jgi:hypothetical protein